MKIPGRDEIDCCDQPDILNGESARLPAFWREVCLKPRQYAVGAGTLPVDIGDSTEIQARFSGVAPVQKQADDRFEQSLDGGGDL